MPLRDDRSQSRAVLTTAAVFLSLSAGSLAAQQPATSARPATHTVKRGDTLWDLAQHYLGDAFLWPEIYRLNTDQIEDPHWIYPGEVLKLPSQAEKTIAAAPEPAPAVVTPVMPTPAPAPALRAPVDSVMPRQTETLPPAIRTGEYIAAPWVDQQNGPRGSGYLITARDLPSVPGNDRSRMHLYDAVFVSPPVGSVAAEHEQYLTYRMGPFIEGFGQIVVPTGIIEVTRSARNGEAATGRVTKMFEEVLEGQRLIPLDSSAAILSGRPAPIQNGKAGQVRYVQNSQQLPSVQTYVVVDLSRRDLTTGDQIELYYPRENAGEGRDLALPEVWIARGEVLRVTPYGATAVITELEQTKIEAGTKARVSAKMP